MIKSGELVLISIAIFLIGLLSVSFDRIIRINKDNSILFEEPVFYLHDFQNLDELITGMKDQLIIFDESEFRWVATLLRYQNFRPGRYQFNEKTSYSDFMSKLARGLQDPMMVTVSGGVTKDRFIERVSQQLRFTETDLLDAMNNDSLLTANGVREHTLIGRMLPNSYEVYWTITPDQFLRRMLREFQTIVIDVHSDRLLELRRNVDEITTMASIIEWEVRHVEEKQRVSGLYWNRIRRNMQLQADPTVNYAVGERRRLLFSDYRVNHPYNTYVIRGLPPGPINNPRYSSILAALFPEDHDYLFMVATPEGYHTFTRTYSEHLRESRKWTTWLREQRQIREQLEAEAKAAEQSSL